MKKLIILPALALAAFMFTASCNSSSAENSAANGTEHADNAVYQCPMKCEGEKTYDKPGQCPVCKMDLEKVETPRPDEGTAGSH